MSRHELDARGLLCPLPVIRTQHRIASLAPGDELEVVASDPGALHDIPAWCRVHGHEVLAARQAGGEIVIVLRVGKT
jgi:tRNA 2-thiouridine synthesizing protein A